MTKQGDILRNYLKVNGISASELAEKLGVNRSTVNSYFSSNNLSSGTITKILEIFPDLSFDVDDEKPEILILKEQIVEYKRRESWMQNLIEKLTPKK